MTFMEVIEARFTDWCDVGYPRPQLCRPHWSSLNGSWEFEEDPNDIGLDERWFVGGQRFNATIQVPFPPGSERSGLPEAGQSDIIWYRRELAARDIPERRAGERLLLHFEAVDYRAQVWVNGHRVAQHVGGFVPFSIDITPYVEDDAPCLITVRAEDRQADVTQPRGKQDWEDETHGMWYERSNGIWRDVWLETRPANAIEHIAWSFDLASHTVTARLEFSEWLAPESLVDIELRQGNVRLALVHSAVSGREGTVRLDIPQVSNRMAWQHLLWSPNHPNLIDAKVQLRSGDSVDTIVSYLGLREVGRNSRYLTINQEPIYVRAVLDQGYWAESYLTPPSPASLAEEVALIRELGFNTARVHQRTPDRRYLTWADRAGLMVWSEFPAAFAYSRDAARRTTEEWMAAIRRDESNPCVVVRVPFNESWGVDAIELHREQQQFVEGIFHLTRALDPDRLVISNDGWETFSTDIVSTHDYATTAQELAVNYADADAVDFTVHGPGPQGRTTLLGERWRDDRPVMVTEFGGISLDLGDARSWGYAVAGNAEEFEGLVAQLVDAIHRSPIVAGFCWTQLTDTGQETNGLCTVDRKPKFSAARIREIMTNSTKHFASHQRPRVIQEVPAGEEQ